MCYRRGNKTSEAEQGASAGWRPGRGCGWDTQLIRNPSKYCRTPGTIIHIFVLEIHP